MNFNNVVHVRIGEVKVGGSEDILKATLGSCVGIIFLWKKKNVFGLAHCLLAEAPESSSFIGANFVSQAVPSLIALLKIKPENLSEIEVHLVGGSNMLSQLSRSIGVLNYVAAKKYLEMHGLKITSEDVGGDAGRQVHVDCNSGDVSVVKLQKANRSEVLARV